MYRLLLHPSIEKQLAKISKPYARRLVAAMRALQEEPRPAQSRHLIQELFRVREGEYRIIYAVFDQEQVVFIGKLARRSEKVYRDLAAVLNAARISVDQK